MTASLPQPDDDAGEDTVSTPPLPAVSAAEAAAAGASPARTDAPTGSGPASPESSRPARPARPKKRAPRTPRAGKTTASARTSPVPPPPAVPASVAAARFDEAAESESEDPAITADEPAVDDAASPDTEVVAETVASAEPEEDPEAAADEQVALDEPEVVVDEQVALDEPEVVVDEQVVLEEPEVVVDEQVALDEPEVVVDEPIEVPAPEEPEPEPEPGPQEETVVLGDESVSDDDQGPAEDLLAVIASDDDGEALPVADVPALRLRAVTKSFGGTRAVDGIDLTVPAGTFYGIVGPNGAGKTTTLSLIAGLLRADAGSIEVAGVDLSADPRRAKQQMGILPDRLRTFDRLTGRQLLHYYGVLRGLASTVVESRTADLARAFDLTEALGRQVSDFSTGMTKKLMLAGAMIHSPRVLVLDEPFESVDPVSSAVILDILAAYVEHGGTVILSSHGMDLVERVCSGVAIIVAGRVLAQGTLDDVRGELSLEQRFIELSAGIADVEGLEWLHTFSD
ncbi:MULTISPECIES: ABC transporter ATP-binding protein [unclassified Microbacterium]|uniref:ABC transporter ATP-binding protein n=1 Tax=unclassified Microbacterium TaxID=2609290 RepID=UPI0030175955